MEYSAPMQWRIHLEGVSGVFIFSAMPHMLIVRHKYSRKLDLHAIHRALVAGNILDRFSTQRLFFVFKQGKKINWYHILADPTHSSDEVALQPCLFPPLSKLPADL